MTITSVPLKDNSIYKIDIFLKFFIIQFWHANL